ncbi:putative potassium-tellurite ethidium and proflavin transporter [Paratrimastix pyriformis]|uniref:Potassium-tellurite ethidium and proflavin transporter n=1 Tax=Paratrimastix pyriformis TaxID=342808 RepID=A0ABQ8UEX2_9EUKA|nr:putative potassium-tellurite ethidium and proflavin transporter [Paratrimastix pyriformis]
MKTTAEKRARTETLSEAEAEPSPTGAAAPSQTQAPLVPVVEQADPIHPPAPTSFTLHPIGIIHSPYQEKFGIPRQPALAPSAPVTLTLLPPYNHPDSVRGLEGFSHVWLSFIFHETLVRGWHPLVRPPRLGGNTKIGVFASRSTHRPNGLGLSLVELKHIDTSHNGVVLHLAGADLLDGTPVLDIKPYIPFVEAKPDARSGFVDGPPVQLTVQWSEKARTDLQKWRRAPEWLPRLIDEVLAQDPRPAYQDEPRRLYGVRLGGCNVRFTVAEGVVNVVEVITPDAAEVAQGQQL